MSKIVEFKGKRLLRDKGFNVPEGVLIRSTGECREAYKKIGSGVLKAQVLTTGRAGKGLIKFPADEKELEKFTKELLGREVEGIPVEVLLYEEKLKIIKELYAGVVVDKVAAAPVLVFSSIGGSGIEEIVEKYPDSVFRYVIDPDNLPDVSVLRDKIRRAGIEREYLDILAEEIAKLVKASIDMEAENLEINPLVILEDGTVAAADCHLTVDDYAVFRHPEFGIEIARELGHPPTHLEKIAWNVEKNDYRGTFYFIQLEQDFSRGQKYVGFHGAGGGGSMMSMDALAKAGYKPANFCDTSGNPPASKIYRAARIILAQENIDGYFGSGSGVASQEQFHGARGIVKALREVDPGFPVVVRLGGNGEDEAVRILEGYTSDLDTPVKCFGKDTSVSECVQVFDTLVKNSMTEKKKKQKQEEGDASGKYSNGFKESYGFPTVTGGRVSFDYDKCLVCRNKVCISGCYGGILKEENGVPVLQVTEKEAAEGRCIECLVCEVDCFESGNGGGRILLPIDGLEDAD